MYCDHPQFIGKETDTRELSEFITGHTAPGGVDSSRAPSHPFFMLLPGAVILVTHVGGTSGTES